MDSVNKTLYIPLYGKSFVSKKNIILKDTKAEEIWDKVNFKLKRKSKSKYLAYFLAMRSASFDLWVKEKMEENYDVIILHLGCGLDSRVLRINDSNHLWYDVDFESVINERKKYYEESDTYKMISSDIRNKEFLNFIPKDKDVIAIIEGVSMYLDTPSLKVLVSSLDTHFNKVYLMMDVYSNLASKLSKYKNPVTEVGVNKVYGLDDPTLVESENVKFIKEVDITSSRYIEELEGIEKKLFNKLYAGKFAKKLYRMYNYYKGEE